MSSTLCDTPKKDLLFKVRIVPYADSIIVGSYPNKLSKKESFMNETKDLREALAEYVHDNWVRWEKYRARALSLDNLQMWWRKSETPFNELTKAEQQSDYDEADRILEIFSGFDKGKK